MDTLIPDQYPLMVILSLPGICETPTYPGFYYHYVVFSICYPVKMRLKAGKMCLPFSRVIPEISFPYFQGDYLKVTI